MILRFLVVLVACSLIGQAVDKNENPILEDVRILSADDMEGRLIGSPGAARARAYLLSRMKSIGLEPLPGGWEQPFTARAHGQPVNGVNLVGLIRGTGSSDRVLLIMAHYDHLGVQDGRIYNGADDNASGVAGLLAIARRFRETPPQHTVIFALTDGEEHEFSGSRALAATPPVPLARIALVVNMDMISKNAAGELYAAGAHHFPWLKPWLEQLAREVPVTLKLGHDGPPWKGLDDWTMLSDHAPFHEKGVPWVYFGVEDHPEYHRPTDKFSTVPKDFFLRVVATVVAASRKFDEDLDRLARHAGR